MTWDACFKQLITGFLERCDVRANEQVGKLPLSIDLVIACHDNDKNGIAIQLFKDHFSKVNIVEYKSGRDNAAMRDLVKLLGYVGLYCDKQDIGIDNLARDVAAWYISSKRPARFRSSLDHAIIERTATAGLYRLARPFPCPCQVLVIEELDIIDANFPLLGFATGTVLKDAILAMDQRRRNGMLSPALENYLTSICVINYEVLHAMTETEHVVPDIIKKNIRMAMHGMGVKEVIDAVGMKVVIDAVGVKEVIDAVGIDRLVEALDDDDIKRLKAKLDLLAL